MKQLWIVLALFVGAGCDKEEGKPGAAGASGGASAGGRTGIVDAWKKAGLEVSALAPATVAFGKDCQSGTAGKVDVLVCEYASAAEATAAKEAALAWVGDTTGMTQASGKVLVAAADRRKADPSGRTINQMMKLAK